MLRSLPYVIIAILVYIMLLYLHNYRPELLTQILIQVDVIGLTPEAKEEHERIAAISQLPIHYEEKEVLMNRTVFLGATPEMVQLALGMPKKSVPDSKNDKGEPINVIYFVYYLPNDTRPTILEFQQDKEDALYKLSVAKKGSALEWGN